MSLVLVISSNEEIIFSVIPVLIILRWPCRYSSYLWPFSGSALAFYWFISSGSLLANAIYICPVDVGTLCIVLYNMYAGPSEHSLLKNLAIVNIYLSLRLDSFIPAFQLLTSDSKYRSSLSLYCSLIVAECKCWLRPIIDDRPLVSHSEGGPADESPIAPLSLVQWPYVDTLCFFFWLPP